MKQVCFLSPWLFWTGLDLAWQAERSSMYFSAVIPGCYNLARIPENSLYSVCTVPGSMEPSTWLVLLQNKWWCSPMGVCRNCICAREMDGRRNGCSEWRQRWQFCDPKCGLVFSWILLWKGRVVNTEWKWKIYGSIVKWRVRLLWKIHKMCFSKALYCGRMDYPEDKI